MPDNQQLQKHELILPGGLGEMTIASTGIKCDITEVVKHGKDSITITLQPKINSLPPIAATEDAEFEIIQPKQIENGKE